MSLEAWGDENPDYADGYLNEDQVAVAIDEATKELQQEVERLRKALYVYGRHLPGCSLRLEPYAENEQPSECTCGLTQEAR